MFIEPKQLKELILDSGLVSKKDFEVAETEGAEKGVSVGQLLVTAGKLSEDDLRRMQAYVLGIPFVDLKGQKIDFEVLSMIPEPIARNNNVIAFKKSEDARDRA